jgi:hypothetical protein
MWSRLDWKRGRFNVNSETSAINRGLRGWQRGTGDSITYFRFDYGSTVVDDVYDEATGAGKTYIGPVNLPVLHANHAEVANSQPRDSGLYLVDTLYCTASFDQLKRAGLTLMDLQHGQYQRDRIAYDNILFDVSQMDIRGQIRRRDVIVTISATQVRDDELVNDQAFNAYFSDPNLNGRRMGGFGG